ncbi:MAG: hypothetical protein HY225_01415 [Candidatus Vogelbacteria bacterium]|nr:hypothetical protein [Candidatus Vogelbacteria bacterium]
MSFFDKDFLKMAFQFMVMVFLGVAIVTFVSSVKMQKDVTAGVVDGK